MEFTDSSGYFLVKCFCLDFVHTEYPVANFLLSINYNLLCQEIILRFSN